MHKVFLRLQNIPTEHSLDDHVSYLGGSGAVAVSVTMLISFTGCLENFFFHLLLLLR